MQTAPKYGTIELGLKGKDKEVLSFQDCGMFISGDHLVIVIDTKDSIQNTQTSQGNIFSLSDLVYYKTYQG